MLKYKQIGNLNINELAMKTAGFVAADLQKLIHKSAENHIERYLNHT